MANVLGDRNLWSSILFALCNAGEAMLAAWLIEHYFGSGFRLASCATCWAWQGQRSWGSRLQESAGRSHSSCSTARRPRSVDDMGTVVRVGRAGNLTVAPLLIELASASRDRPSRAEIVEGIVAVAALALVCGLAIFLRSDILATVGPVTLLFAPLLWLAARCRPVFAPAAAFIVSLSIVWTTTFGIGYFGNPDLSMAERVLAAQISIHPCNGRRHWFSPPCSPKSATSGGWRSGSARQRNATIPHRNRETRRARRSRRGGCARNQ